MKKRKLTANAYIPTRFFVGASGEAMESAVSPGIHPLGAAALLGRQLWDPGGNDLAGYGGSR